MRSIERARDLVAALSHLMHVIEDSPQVSHFFRRTAHRNDLLHRLTWVAQGRCRALDERNRRVWGTVGSERARNHQCEVNLQCEGTVVANQ